VSDRAPWDSPAVDDLAELRELILGAERRRLQELERRLDAAGLTREELAELLPEAIVLRAGRDRQLARALAPTVENAIGESVRRNPRQIATAIFPVLGPAIRKAIADALAGLVASINSALEHSVSPRGLRWRLEAWRTGVPFAQIVLKHALVYRVEQVFLIHAETGLLLSHAWTPELPPSDPDLISGMLTAIRDFVADSFARDGDAGGLRRFTVGELTVMVEQGPQAILAAVVRGQAPDTLLAKLQDTLERVHLEYADALAGFEGDTTPFEPARPLLEECLATVISTDREKDRLRPAAWLPWVAVAVLVLALIALLRFRSEQRWQRAVERLESEPGIVLTQAQRAGGRWSFAGLRDPLAPEPAALLASVGADTSRVSASWEPYLSLRPELVLARARRSLAPPSTVSFDQVGDTLRVHGSAPLRWLAATARTASLPAGVAVLDLRGVEPIVPAELASVKREIEGRRVLFDLGVAALRPEERAEANDVAAGFARLQAGAAKMGVRAGLELVGRTDPTGADSTNRALSRSRAEAVLAALVARGVTRDVIRLTAAGTTDPLTAADPGERARINRSVSFMVSLGWDGTGREPAR
jgi:outer membrane protein OmpA-like peptidoglycan-associated protein